MWSAAERLRLPCQTLFPPRSLREAADQGDTKTLPGTLEAAKANLETVGQAPSPEDPAKLVADKGYHYRDDLKALEDSAWNTRLAEPKPNGILRWKGDYDAKRAFYNNRARLLSALRSPSIAVACAEPGYAAVTICKNAI